LVVALVIGLVVGTGGATLVWTLTDSRGVADGAEGDVAIACQLIGRTSLESTEARAFIEDFGRWNAARVLVVNAASRNPRYQQLEEALSDGAQVASATYQAKGPEFEKYAQEARKVCDGL
jgi:hypothetical protein